MKPLEQRVSTLEVAQGYRGASARVALLAPHGRLSEADQAQADAARAAGRDVLVIVLVPVPRCANA